MTQLDQLQHVDRLTSRRVRIWISQKHENPAQVAYSLHALARAVERNITPLDVQKILSHGEFTQPLKQQKNKEEAHYKFQLAGITAGRQIEVVGLIRANGDGKLFIITVMDVFEEGSKDNDC